MAYNCRFWTTYILEWRKAFVNIFFMNLKLRKSNEHISEILYSNVSFRIQIDILNQGLTRVSYLIELLYGQLMFQYGLWWFSALYYRRLWHDFRRMAHHNNWIDSTMEYTAFCKNHWHKKAKICLLKPKGAKFNKTQECDSFAPSERF